MTMGFWRMGEYIETGRTTGASVIALKTEHAVLERRADMAAQCECLAAWDEERECVCNKTVEVPVSVERLEKAHSIVGEISRVERYAEIVRKSEGSNLKCATERYRRDGVYFSDGNHYHSVDEGYQVLFSLPKAVVLAALNDERMRLLAQLAETGIVSVDRPNIKAVPR